MDISLIKNYLAQQEEMWQLLFKIFFLKNFKQTTNLVAEIQVEQCVDFCCNSEDLKILGKTIQYANQNYETLMDKIDYLIQSKSFVWQLDFIKSAEIEFNQTFLHDFIPVALIEAYCWLFSEKPEKLNLVTECVDKNCLGTIQALSRREAIIKRNFLLILEGVYGSKTLCAINELTFRDIIDLYINTVPTKEIRKAYLKAQAAADKTEGNTDLARNALKYGKEFYDYAYYSPYFSDRENIQRPSAPKGAITKIAQDFLQHCYDNLWLKNDDDDEDTSEKVTRLTVFADFQDQCVIDVRMENEFYAHIYIKKQPNSYTSNYIPEFLVCENDFIYTVEFIDFDEESPIKNFAKSVIQTHKEFVKLCEQIESIPENTEEYFQCVAQGFNSFKALQNNYIIPPVS